MLFLIFHFFFFHCHHLNTKSLQHDVLYSSYGKSNFIVKSMNSSTKIIHKNWDLHCDFFFFVFVCFMCLAPVIWNLIKIESKRRNFSWQTLCATNHNFYFYRMISFLFRYGCCFQNFYRFSATTQMPRRSNLFSSLGIWLAQNVNKLKTQRNADETSI